jgi:hypothetical protein
VLKADGSEERRRLPLAEVCRGAFTQQREGALRADPTPFSMFRSPAVSAAARSRANVCGVRPPDRPVNYQISSSERLLMTI